MQCFTLIKHIAVKIVCHRLWNGQPISVCQLPSTQCAFRFFFFFCLSHWVQCIVVVCIHCMCCFNCQIFRYDVQMRVDLTKAYRNWIEFDLFCVYCRKTIPNAIVGFQSFDVVTTVLLHGISKEMINEENFALKCHWINHSLAITWKRFNGRLMKVFRVIIWWTLHTQTHSHNLHSSLHQAAHSIISVMHMN